MAILEINVHEPAFKTETVTGEEKRARQNQGRSRTRSVRKRMSRSRSSGSRMQRMRGMAKKLGMVMVVAGMAMGGWKLRNRRKKSGTKQSTLDETKETDVSMGERGRSHGQQLQLFGLVSAIVTAVLLARKFKK